MRNRKFRTDFEMQINVVFSNPEQAINFWQSEHFAGMWKIHSIEHLAQSMASSFHHEATSWCDKKKQFVKDIEGYGIFEPVENGQGYKCDYTDWPKEYGLSGLVITIDYEQELEADEAIEV